MATTNNGVAATVNNTEADALTYSTDDAAAVFLNRWDKEAEDNESSSEVPEDTPDEEEESVEETEEAEDTDEAAEEEVEDEEESETDPEEETEEETEETDDGETDNTDKKKKVLDDEAVVKLKVDDQELEVSVKDLKRLYGQEAALTRKSQQVAEKRKALDADGMKLAASLERMYQKAEERWKPYAEIDMLVASKQLDTDTFAALRKEAQAAYDDYRFISEEVDSFVKQTESQRQAQLQEAAKEAVEVLKKRIPEWSPKVYDSIREYGISQGMDEVLINNLTNPIALEMMHKARLYDESKKIATKKKVATPKKIMKTTAPVSNRGDVKSERIVKTAQKLKSSGSSDDAADLFLSRWESDE